MLGALTQQAQLVGVVQQGEDRRADQIAGGVGPRHDHHGHQRDQLVLRQLVLPVPGVDEAGGEVVAGAAALLDDQLTAVVHEFLERGGYHGLVAGVVGAGVERALDGVEPCRSFRAARLPAVRKLPFHD
nr:hypothetical protein [Streptomyces sp. H51]